MNNGLKLSPYILNGDTDLPPETPLYRYLSTEAFLYLLTFERVFFSKVSEWPDSLDGTRFEFLKKARDDKEVGTTGLNDFFVSCWTLQTEERRFYKDDSAFVSAQKELTLNGSAAMWESYCKNGGVRIKTTLGKVEALFSAHLPEWRICRGKVYYEPAEDGLLPPRVPSLVATLMHKRASFRSESEYRFVLLPEVVCTEPREAAKVENLFEFLDEILVSPATSSTVWLSRTLYNIAVGVTIKPPKRTCINIKNGKQFCRISQLCKEVSETVGHGSMT